MNIIIILLISLHYYLSLSTQMMSALKTGEIANSRMASIVQRKRENEQKISVDRSGGGL